MRLMIIKLQTNYTATLWQQVWVAHLLLTFMSKLLKDPQYQHATTPGLSRGAASGLARSLCQPLLSLVPRRQGGSNCIVHTRDQHPKYERSLRSGHRSSGRLAEGRGRLGAAGSSGGRGGDARGRGAGAMGREIRGQSA